MEYAENTTDVASSLKGKTDVEGRVEVWPVYLGLFLSRTEGASCLTPCGASKRGCFLKLDETSRFACLWYLYGFSLGCVFWCSNTKAE